MAFIEARKIRISTTIPYQVYAEIKKMNWHYNELICRGLATTRAKESIIEQFQDLEKTNNKLVEKVRELALRVYDLEEKKAKEGGKKNE